MATLTTVDRAPVLDQAGAILAYSAVTAVSADPTVLTTQNSNNKLYVVAGQPGTTTLTVTRTADGSVAHLEVTVAAPAVPFSISLGAPIPK